jgi:hypothetical protein
MSHGHGHDLPERRSEKRWPCQAEVAVLPVLSDGGFLKAQLTDFSEHGLGLIARHPLCVGEQFMVKVKLQQGVTLLVYTTRACLPHAAGYHVDAAFSHVLAPPGDAELVRAHFIWHLEALASSESRGVA